MGKLVLHSSQEMVRGGRLAEKGVMMSKNHGCVANSEKLQVEGAAVAVLVVLEVEGMFASPLSLVALVLSPSSLPSSPFWSVRRSPWWLQVPIRHQHMLTTKMFVFKTERYVR